MGRRETQHSMHATFGKGFHARAVVVPEAMKKWLHAETQ